MDNRETPCMGEGGTIAPFPSRRTGERHAIDLLVRFAWKGLRGTVMLKDLTSQGARIEGMEALREGDGLTLLLPGLAPCDATVAWAHGHTAGMAFDCPLPASDLAALIRDYAPAATDRYLDHVRHRRASPKASPATDGAPVMRVA